MGAKCANGTAQGQESIWRDYKAVSLHHHATAAWFQDNASLIEWVNGQPLAPVVTCLGDGHDGIWNIVALVATPQERQEILDWYHLNENLFKVGGSRKRLRQAEALLFSGNIEAAIALFADSPRKQAQNFCAYLAIAPSPHCQL